GGSSPAELCEADDPADDEVRPDDEQGDRGDPTHVSREPAVEAADLDCGARGRDEVTAQRDLGRQEHDQVEANDERRRRRRRVVELGDVLHRDEGKDARRDVQDDPGDERERRSARERSLGPCRPVVLRLLARAAPPARPRRTRRPAISATTPAARSTPGLNDCREPENRLEPRSTNTITSPMVTVVSSDATRKTDRSFTGCGLASATTTTATRAGQTIEASASTRISASATGRFSGPEQTPPLWVKPPLP